jgi:hypothetical protein
MSKKLDLTGKRFGRLVALFDIGKRNSQGCVIWRCLCDCGSFTKVNSSNLRTGHIKSCGCLLKEKTKIRRYKHGDSNASLYHIWIDMKQRCNNKNHHAYKWYGAKKIRICEEWEKDYLAFKQWALIHNCKSGLTIDRIDNNQGYCPENCQWITRAENTRKATSK